MSSQLNRTDDCLLGRPEILLTWCIERTDHPLDYLGLEHTRDP